MTTTWLRLVLIAVLLAPTVAPPAGAQTPPPAPPAGPPPVAPPPPAAPPTPTPPGAGAPPPTVIVVPPGSSIPPTVIDPGPVPYRSIEVTRTHRVGAAVLNVFYVPGKVITCGAGLGAAGLLLLATFGSQYPWAVRLTEEGCGYPWVLRPEHVAGQDPRDDR
jgi:hypothetical protein